MKSMLSILMHRPLLKYAYLRLQEKLRVPGPIFGYPWTSYETL